MWADERGLQSMGMTDEERLRTSVGVGMMRHRARTYYSQRRVMQKVSKKKDWSDKGRGEGNRQQRQSAQRRGAFIRGRVGPRDKIRHEASRTEEKGPRMSRNQIGNIRIRNDEREEAKKIDATNDAERYAQMVCLIDEQLDPLAKSEDLLEVVENDVFDLV
ncbi:hypothetical protein BKA62DRAFT_456443 [Auriculariales sp. MPI-PUGE-AT-0066]|nr:hypothetical protein BKA62DRAFT_456443 [Auriculariales sp. MPI-PUGE-AT-0066]